MAVVSGCSALVDRCARRPTLPFAAVAAPMFALLMARRHRAVRVFP